MLHNNDKSVLSFFDREVHLEDPLRQMLLYKSNAELFRLKNINGLTYENAVSIIFERRGYDAVHYQEGLMTAWLYSNSISTNFSFFKRINRLFNDRLFNVISMCFLDPAGGLSHKFRCIQVMAACLQVRDKRVFINRVIDETYQRLSEPALPPRRILDFFYSHNTAHKEIIRPLGQNDKDAIEHALTILEQGGATSAVKATMFSNILNPLLHTNDQESICRYLLKLINLRPSVLPEISITKILNHAYYRRISRDNLIEKIFEKVQNETLLTELKNACIAKINAINESTSVSDATKAIGLITAMALSDKTTIRQHSAFRQTIVSSLLSIVADGWCSKITVKNCAEEAMIKIIERDKNAANPQVIDFIFTRAQKRAQNNPDPKDFKLSFELALVTSDIKLKSRVCDYAHKFFMQNLFVNFDLARLASAHSDLAKRKKIFNDYITKGVHASFENLFALFNSLEKSDDQLKGLLSYIESKSPFLNWIIFPQKLHDLHDLLDLLDLCDASQKSNLVDNLLNMRRNCPLLNWQNEALSRLLILIFTNYPDIKPSVGIEEVYLELRLASLYLLLNKERTNIVTVENFLLAEQLNKINEEKVWTTSTLASLYNHLAYKVTLDDSKITQQLSEAIHNRTVRFFRSSGLKSPLFGELPSECFDCSFLDSWHNSIIMTLNNSSAHDKEKWEELREILACGDDSYIKSKKNFEQIVGLSDELKNKLFAIADFFLFSEATYELSEALDSAIKALQHTNFATENKIVNEFFCLFRNKLLRHNNKHLRDEHDAQEEQKPKRQRLI